MIGALVALMAADNSVDTLKESMSRHENVEEVCDEDFELFHFFECIGCKAIFCEKGKLVRHVRTFDNW